MLAARGVAPGDAVLLCGATSVALVVGYLAVLRAGAVVVLASPGSTRHELAHLVADSGAVLMVAHMNAEALAATLESGEATFFSRSRGRLWKKGETSGHVMRLVEARIDCDQDALWLRCEPAGPACHTGESSCFYRRVERDGGALTRVISAAATDD